tara:strand:- start:5014 stop:5373 length:360 start_codon:yes stop_codon:yes gene_type:complete
MVLFVSACASSAAEQTLNSEKKPLVIAIKEYPKMKISQSWQQVTVKYLNLEGGFYGLVSKNGSKLLPKDLPKKYKIDGTTLRVEGHLINNMVTIQQWGKPFKVTNVELIKMGTGKQSTH